MVSTHIMTSKTDNRMKGRKDWVFWYLFLSLKKKHLGAKRSCLLRELSSIRQGIALWH